MPQNRSVRRPHTLLGAASVAMLAACTGTSTPPPAAPAPLTAPFAADTVREQELHPGVRHTYRWMPAGPWAVHVVEVAPGTCGVAFRSAKGGNRVVGRETTSALARRVGEQLSRPVPAAVNADFFLFDPPGVPVGPQVMAGEAVSSGGVVRDVFGVHTDGTPFLSSTTLGGSLRLPSGRVAPVERVNRPPQDASLSLYNRFAGEVTPVDTGVVEVVVRPLPNGGRVGDTVRAVVVALDTLAAGVPIAAQRQVVAGRGEVAALLREEVAAGDTLVWVLGLSGLDGTVREVVGGFPLLLQKGERVFEQNPALRAPFSETRHPRTAVGIRPDGSVLLVVVDGRQPGYSAGMSLSELADLFQALGSSDAINLDGGGSTTLAIDGRVANRPSDANGERPVANALLLLGAPAGSCAGR